MTKILALLMLLVQWFDKKFVEPKLLLTKMHGDAVPFNVPKYKGDVGIDIPSYFGKNNYTLIRPNCWNVIRSGHMVKIHDGYWGNVKPRSSTFAKLGLVVAESVIDPNYNGELGVHVFNPTGRIIKVENGDRIAQLVIIKKPRSIKFQYVDTLPSTERNANRMGSSGK